MTRRRLALPLLRLIVAGLFALPLLFMALSAFRPVGQSLAAFWPQPLTLDNFRRLFAALPITDFTLRSLLIVAVAVPLTVVTASWAGFALARLPRPAAGRWVTLSLLALMIPGVALWPARFLLYSRLGLAGSLWALVVPAFAGGSPFFVLMFYRAFRRIPPAIYDTARLDGAGVLATWGRVALPIARATTTAVAVLAFVLFWGDFISPQLYVAADRYTLPVGLKLLEQLARSDYPVLMAGALWAMLAPLALVLLGVGIAAAAERRRASPDINE